MWGRESIEESRCWNASTERAFIKSRGAKDIRRATQIIVLASESESKSSFTGRECLLRCTPHSSATKNQMEADLCLSERGRGRVVVPES
jgi:hypothetical protein